MSFRFVSHAARVLGFVVSPLLTAPAAAADLARGVRAVTPVEQDPAALHVVDRARREAPAGTGRRRTER
jgi:hypothetical protein